MENQKVDILKTGTRLDADAMAMVLDYFENLFGAELISESQKLQPPISNLLACWAIYWVKKLDELGVALDDQRSLLEKIPKNHRAVVCRLLMDPKFILQCATE